MVLGCARQMLPAALLLLGLLWADRACAATVILVPPANPSQAMAEAMVRVRGELTSEGFDVELAKAPEPGEVSGGREEREPQGPAEAVVAMLGAEVPDAVEIRMADPLTGKRVVRRMSFQPTSEVSAKTLAIHTLELIRATFLELDLVPAPRRPPAPPPPSAMVAEAAPRGPRQWSVDLGATAIAEASDLTPTLMPILRLSWALRPWLLPQLVAAGFGTRRTLVSQGDSATLSEQFALVGASYRFRAATRVRPFLSLSAGVLHVSAQGQANPPDWSRTAQQWALLFDGAAGSWLALGERYQVALAVQAQLAEPYPAVRLSGAAAKPVARPSLLLTMTVGCWL